MTDYLPTLGRVTSVEAKKGVVYVNVQHDRPGLEDDSIPFVSLSPGSVLTPQQGDIVELYKMSGGGTAARFCHSPPRYDMPDMGENEMLFRFDDNSEISFRKDGDGRYVARISGDVRVELEAQEEARVLAGTTIELGNSGSELVTDVTTTKDGDGHVTDISLTKTTKTKAE